MKLNQKIQKKFIALLTQISGGYKKDCIALLREFDQAMVEFKENIQKSKSDTKRIL